MSENQVSSASSGPLLPAQARLISLDELTAAIGRGVRKALEEHAAAGRSVAIARNGEVVVVPAEALIREQDARSEN